MKKPKAAKAKTKKEKPEDENTTTETTETTTTATEQQPVKNHSAPDDANTIKTNLQNDLQDAEIKAAQKVDEVQNDGSSETDGDKTQQPPAENETGATESESAPEEKVEEKVETRGRHKKDCQCQKCSDRRTNAGKKSNSAADDLKNDLGKYKETPLPQDAAPVVGVNLAQFISGALLLMAMDGILPPIVLKFAKKRSKKFAAVQARELKLTKDEREELEPLADEVVKSLFGNVHPVVGFFVAYVAIMAGKLVSVGE